MVGVDREPTFYEVIYELLYYEYDTSASYLT